jgi:predicted ATPase
MIGRADELGQLQSAWIAAEQGEGSVVLVAGEPGIGKTRLAAELAEHAHATGGTVLYGRSYDENLISYQPFREAIRQYSDATPTGQLRDDLAHDGAMLTRLVPELLARVPDLPPPVKAEPDTERYLLFEAVVSTLIALSARAPMLLVLDDLHWADHSTALLMARVARACPGARVMMLGTYRSEEVGNDHPLAAVVASLRRSATSACCHSRACHAVTSARLSRPAPPGAHPMSLLTLLPPTPTVIRTSSVSWSGISPRQVRWLTCAASTLLSALPEPDFPIACAK